jgi:hypothetical protein
MKRKEYKKLSANLYEILNEKYNKGALVVDSVSIYAYRAIRAFSEDKTIVRLLSYAIQNKDEAEIYGVFEKWLKANKIDYAFAHIMLKLEDQLMWFQLVTLVGACMMLINLCVKLTS